MKSLEEMLAEIEQRSQRPTMQYKDDCVRLIKALKLALKALPCDSGVEESGEQCSFCFAKDQIAELLAGEEI